MDKKGNNEINLTTENCPITSVTVYKDRAEVCRSVATSVIAGVNELKISGFVTIEEDSIRVEGQGKATIAEVSFQTKSATEDEASMSEKEKAMTEELKAFNEEKKQLDPDSQAELLKKQWSVLDQFASNAAKAGQGHSEDGNITTPHLDEAYFKGMKDFIQQYHDIGKQFDTEKLELKKKTDDLNEKIKKVQTNLQALRGGRRNATQTRECIVVLEATEETPVQLKLSYVVYGASWIPSYDLRMNTEDGILKMSYYGLISQHSGEDWADVKLHLSTAEPSVGGIIPTLPQSQVSIMKARMMYKSRKSAGFSPRSRSFMAPPQPQPFMATLETEMDDEMIMAAPMNIAAVEVQETTVSASYEIARLSSIPSDNTPHKVTVGIAELKPTMTYITVPKVVPNAFLQAKVVNTSQFTFLAGKTNIFLDNSFVAKAEIQAVAPKEEFECSLGVDPGVRVTYKPLVKVNSSSGIISKTTTISHEQAIELKNVHNYPVKVTVKDNLPRSLDDKVKVTLQSPYIDTKHPEKSEALQTKDNTIQWEVTVKALEKTELLLKYTIDHPAGESLDHSTV